MRYLYLPIDGTSHGHSRSGFLLHSVWPLLEAGKITFSSALGLGLGAETGEAEAVAATSEVAAGREVITVDAFLEAIALFYEQILSLKITLVNSGLAD